MHECLSILASVASTRIDAKAGRIPCTSAGPRHNLFLNKSLTLRAQQSHALNGRKTAARRFHWPARDTGVMLYPQCVVRTTTRSGVGDSCLA